MHFGGTLLDARCNQVEFAAWVVGWSILDAPPLKLTHPQSQRSRDLLFLSLKCGFSELHGTVVPDLCPPLVAISWHLSESWLFFLNIILNRH